MGIFTYEDMFLTKGIEYLLVIDFLLIFILFWKALTTPMQEIRKLKEKESKDLVNDV